MEEETQRNFAPINVVTLLDGKHHFIIPSFQRGYRWGTTQVEDLLNDLRGFIRASGDQKSYFLQPLVVKEREDGKWEVLDGQQRLTTMLLVLKRALRYLRRNDEVKFKNQLYTITYVSRPEMDFDNPDPEDNIDGFFLANSKRVIDNWFDELDKSTDDTTADMIADSLFKNENSKLVKFIWYCVEEKGEVDSIQIFNRLNRGKIKLTSSELIKALLILNSPKSLDTDKLALEWDIMEKQFQDDAFWYFISNKKDDVQTRMDLLFDFVTRKGKDDDDDFSYRKFQNLYDYTHSNTPVELDILWQGLEQPSFDFAWKLVKQTYDILVHWYEDKRFYHYIGFLVYCGDSPLDIYRYIEENKDKDNWDDDKTISLLKRRISSKFKWDQESDFIDSLDYDATDIDVLRKVLLLFNIETYQIKKYIRFPFDAFKQENWDIEHVDSQTEHGMQLIEDKINWLDFTAKSLAMDRDDQAVSLKELCHEMKEKFSASRKEEGHEFDDLYKQVVIYYTRENDKEVNFDSINKNSIDNLTLLDSGTNRGYGNAPYPYKRSQIIKNDKSGKFVPICTKNLFLKYYSDIDKPDAQTLAIRWHSEDQEQYKAAIHKLLDPYFIKKQK